MAEEIKRTSKEWYDLLYPKREIVILGPDGWDRGNWSFSWEEELINQNEFTIRLFRSTCQGKIPKTSN